MPETLTFSSRNEHMLPPQFNGDDVRFSDAFAEYFIGRYTRLGDTVFDPFAGFGTALYAAERLGRKPLGVELLPERAEYIKANLRDPGGVILGDSLALGDIDLPGIDFSLTSPPYMRRSGHPQYPFAGYAVTGQGYDDYLRDIAGVYRQIKRRLKPGAYAVIEAVNYLDGNAPTMLADNIADAVGGVLALERKIEIRWIGETGYERSFALVFSNR